MDSTHKLFSWVQNKINGKQAKDCQTNNCASIKNQPPRLVEAHQKEEFSDWPQGFLSIGTLFTNKSSKEDTKDQHNNNTNNNPILDFTLEEVKELQKELNTLMSSNDLDCLTGLGTENEKNNTHSSPSNYVEEDYDYDDGDEEKDHNDGHHFTSNVVTNNKAKDVYLDRKKSLSFLLKKAFVCGVGGLGPTSSLRDPTLSARKISLSKILRAMLRKKIYPQNSCPTTSRKKCLGNGHLENSKNYDDENESDDVEENDQIKWDKTDTEYIVLEI